MTRCKWIVLGAIPVFRSFADDMSRNFTLKSSASIGCLAALSTATVVYAVFSVGAALSHDVAQTVAAFVLGPAAFFLKPGSYALVSVLPIVIFVVHFCYWWFALLEPWPTKLLTRVCILISIHFGTAVVFWVKLLERMP
ncbi:hypothetical protein Poly59_31360 [Rubripirellula reticaptiva]|uniref:Uncharacterized protein n=2 Tax=Rubripirellula reticaptiva TaxID=2528013 RepID=A0A5C6ET40_9BACT|nr:hypothetical protein Poly59_31360 [Rubripirellula reticaptiva]